MKTFPQVVEDDRKMTRAEIVNLYEWPLVSIVTPSFNQAEFIEDTIRSVLEQDYPRLEYIVVDGGSTDGTIDILKKYHGKIHWVSEPDDGQTNAINKGFLLAKGEILGWINSDDFYLPGAIKTAITFLRNHPEFMMVHGDCQVINSNGSIKSVRKTADFGLDKLIGVDTIAQPTVLFRRQVLKMIGLLNERLEYVFDWEFWVRMGIKNLKTKHIPVVLAAFREHRESKTLSRKELFWQERFLVLGQIFSSADTPVEIKSLEQRAFSGVFASSAYFYLQHGKVRKFLVTLYKSVRMWPGILFQYNPFFVARALWEVGSSWFRALRFRV